MPFNNPGEVDAFTLSSVTESWSDAVKKLEARNEKLETLDLQRKKLYLEMCDRNALLKARNEKLESALRAADALIIGWDSCDQRMESLVLNYKTVRKELDDGKQTDE